MSTTENKLTFRLQLVHSLCWERDPSLKDISRTLHDPGKTGIEKIRFHLYHGINEEPKAGSLPCHHTELWQLWSGANLVRKESSPIARLLSKALELPGHTTSFSPDSLVQFGKDELTGLSPDQVEGAARDLKMMFAELDGHLRCFFDDVSWCVGSRSSSRIQELGWPMIDSKNPPGHFDFHFRPSTTRWKRESIDLSRYVPGASAPFSSALMGEAWEALEHSDRSAFVIAHIAAEAATKECVASIVPGAHHIVDGVQAPPLPNLLEMLCDNIDDDLASRLRDESVWGATSEEFCAASGWVRKRANLRNKIVHGHDELFTAAEVVAWLKLYEQLITLLWLARDRQEGSLGPVQALFDDSWAT